MRKSRKGKEEKEQSYARFALQLGGRLALWSTIAQIVPGLLILFVGLPSEGRAAVFGTLLVPWLLALGLGALSLVLVYLQIHRALEKRLNGRGCCGCAMCLASPAAWRASALDGRRAI